jgi:hypothetical protein
LLHDEELGRLTLPWHRVVNYLFFLFLLCNDDSSLLLSTLLSFFLLWFVISESIQTGEVVFGHHKLALWHEATAVEIELSLAKLHWFQFHGLHLDWSLHHLLLTHHPAELVWSRHLRTKSHVHGHLEALIHHLLLLHLHLHLLLLHHLPLLLLVLLLIILVLLIVVIVESLVVIVLVELVLLPHCLTHLN